MILCEGATNFSDPPDLLDRLGEHLAVPPKTWTFAALQIPTTRAAALQTAREAGVIVVSAQSNSDLPNSVQTFLQQALARRPELPAPIALLAESKSDASAASNVSRKLRRLANSAGTEFFVLAPPDTASSAKNPSGHSDAPPSIGATRQRHWGINE